MTRNYIQKWQGDQWIQTGTMFLEHGELVRCMKERHWFLQLFLGDKFLAMTRWDYYPDARRFMLTTMTDDGKEEMWP